MVLTKGDIVTFLGEEEREAKYGTTSYGYPRVDNIIEYSGAVAGIVYDELCSGSYKIRLIGANKIWCNFAQSWEINEQSIKGVVGHIGNIDFKRAAHDSKYVAKVYNQLPLEIQEAAKIDKEAIRHERTQYSADVLRIACDMVDEFGGKCIASRNDTSNKFDFSPAFTYNSNAHLESGEEQTSTQARLFLGDAKRSKALIDRMERIRFTFGYNHLYAGEAALCILDMLEARYGLDFNELEKEFQKKSKRKTRKQRSLSHNV